MAYRRDSEFVNIVRILFNLKVAAVTTQQARWHFDICIDHALGIDHDIDFWEPLVVCPTAVFFKCVHTMAVMVQMLQP